MQMKKKLKMRSKILKVNGKNVTYRLTTSTTGDDTHVTMGIILVGHEAFDAGGASLPDPANQHADWMFWDSRAMISARDVTDIDEMAPNGFLQIRNKSMRKMRENHQVLAMIFRTTVQQPTSIQVFVGGRALVLLP